MPARAVMDTNVLYAGLRSQRGASFELLRLLRAGKWTLLLSNTVVTEYEEILQREASLLRITSDEIAKLLDDLCAPAECHRLSGPWQPILSDPDDEAFVHLASEAKADYLISHNRQHYGPAGQCGIQVVTPREFLGTIRTKI